MSGQEPKGSPKDSHYARLRREHRDRQTGGETAYRPRKALPPGEATADGLVRLYGLHTVAAALANPRRTIRRLMLTRNAAERIGLADPGRLEIPVQFVLPKDIDRITGSDAVHQGALAEAEPLRPKPLRDLSESDLVVVLDQVTDPHNVGAVMRSAVAFGAGALITTARHSPAETGVLAKAASGALEHLDLIEVRNLAAALDEIAGLGFQTIGLDSDAPAGLETSLAGSRIAIVLGAEGHGLRQKTRATVAALARLDMPGAIRSLNVSNAAAIALYASRRHLGGN